MLPHYKDGIDWGTPASPRLFHLSFLCVRSPAKNSLDDLRNRIGKSGCCDCHHHGSFVSTTNQLEKACISTTMKVPSTIFLSVQVLGAASTAQIKTSSGIVSGHPASNATGVSEYLGIPFAQPPLGKLRFQPPVALSSPNSVVNGSNHVNNPSPSLSELYVENC